MFSKAWWQREVTFGSVTATLAGTVLGLLIGDRLLRIDSSGAGYVVVILTITLLLKFAFR